MMFGSALLVAALISPSGAGEVHVDVSSGGVELSVTFTFPELTASPVELRETNVYVNSDTGTFELDELAVEREISTVRGVRTVRRLHVADVHVTPKHGGDVVTAIVDPAYVHVTVDPDLGYLVGETLEGTSLTVERVAPVTVRGRPGIVLPVGVVLYTLFEAAIEDWANPIIVGDTLRSALPGLTVDLGDLASPPAQECRTVSLPLIPWPLVDEPTGDHCHYKFQISFDANGAMRSKDVEQAVAAELSMLYGSEVTVDLTGENPRIVTGEAPPWVTEVIVSSRSGLQAVPAGGAEILIPANDRIQDGEPTATARDLRTAGLLIGAGVVALSGLVIWNVKRRRS